MLSNWKFYAIIVLIFFGLIIIGQSCTKVEPGYVGIKVNMYGDQRGVNDFPIVTGRVWLNPFSEDIYKFPTFLQSIVWTKDRDEGSPKDESITFNSIEGAVLNADIAMSYGFVSEYVPALFVEYRKSAEEITNVYMRSQVRDAFSIVGSQMKVVDIFGTKKSQLLDSVKIELNNRLGKKGFRFDMVSFVGALRVDNRVEASINAVIEATQRAIEAENKVRQATAEADQKIETARGDAESIRIAADAKEYANRKIRNSVDATLIQWELLKKWDGKLPQVTGGAIPLIDLK